METQQPEDNPLNWSSETRDKYAEIIRQMSQHEDHLSNHRLTWFVTLQGLLFAGLAFAWTNGNLWLIGIVASMGIAIAGSSINGTRLGAQAHDKLQQWWEENLPTYKGPGRVGLFVVEEPVINWFVRPWIAIPYLFIVAWIGLFFAKYNDPRLASRPAPTIIVRTNTPLDSIELQANKVHFISQPTAIPRRQSK